MTTLLCTTTLTLSLLLPSTTPATTPAITDARGFTTAERAVLQARCEPEIASVDRLAAMRAGSASTPRALDASERTALTAAERSSDTLVALRGGSEPSNNEWRWLAIGAGIVLLIVLL
ncbi:MAG: hypothetical protein IPJ77_21610 [Planctomycetes bacterium]|nr:hypothetical protein [Planctomycetota bacterium]